MRLLQLLILLPFLAFSHGDDLYLLKGAKVFLGNDGFVVKDILVDDGKIILVEDFIENIETGKILDLQGKFITPGLLVFSSLGLLEIGALPETNDTGSDIYNAGFDPSRAYNPFSQAVRLNRSKGVTSTISIPGASGYFSGMLSYTKINNGLKQKKQGPLGLVTSYGQSFNDSRAASLMYMEDLFSYVRTNHDDNYADMTQFMLGTTNEYRFTSRDFKAIKKVLDNEMPLVVKVNKATDILNVIKFAEAQEVDLVPVSYTHLTLPTILRV